MQVPLLSKAVPWEKDDLDAMVEAVHRVIEAHYNASHPFHNPINQDAMLALRSLRGYLPYMKEMQGAPDTDRPIGKGDALAALSRMPDSQKSTLLEGILQEMGKVKQSRLSLLPPNTCPDCEGEGEVGGQFCGGYLPCEKCSGTGKI